MIAPAPPRKGARALWEAVAGLPVEVSRLRIEARDGALALGEPRRARRCSLIGAGHEELEGVGEDVAFGPGVHPTLDGDARRLDGLLGRRTLGEACAALDTVDLGPGDACAGLIRRFRRWAIEAALLDLALQQNGVSLPEVVALEARPLTFVTSRRIDWASWEPELDALARRQPVVGLKVNFHERWDQRTIAALRAGPAVAVVDFKVGFEREGVALDALERVLDGLPGALVEDPGEVARSFAPPGRVAADLPMRDVADLDRMAVAPGAVNLKPARIGSLRELSAWYERAAADKLPVYGGGWAEQFAGREQAQLLAALFHPDGPNDLAPGAYNLPDGEGGPRPASPLTVDVPATGFTRRFEQSLGDGN